MAWNIYKIVFRMESPLHSGWLKVGNIQRTRLHVTGRMMWGALTANITRIIGGSYSAVGENVKKYLIASYFFPCFDKNGEKKLVLPFYDENILNYIVGNDEVTANMIERALITSYNSTSIDPNGLSAEDGTLHEIELLNHRTIYPIHPNSGNLTVEDIDTSEDTIPINSNIYLVGYIFESSKIPLEIKNNWVDALKMIQLGGERSYGFGCLRLEKIIPEPEEKGQKGEPKKSLHLEKIIPEHLNVFGYNVVSTDEEIKIKLNQGKQVLANVFNVDDLLGTLEPFFGRNSNENGEFKKKYSSVKVSWSPGSVLKKKRIFKISEFGLWEGVS